MRLAAFLLAALLALSAMAQGGEKWVTTWAASAHGPYPVGNASAQPKLDRVFPAPESGARDRSFRLVLRPSLWGRHARIRLSNVFGTRPVTFDAVYIGLQASGGPGDKLHPNRAGYLAMGMAIDLKALGGD